MSYRHKYNKTFYGYIERGSISSAEIVLPILMNNVKFNSVIDIGCGLGAWLSVFKNIGIKDILGIDGAYVSVDNLLIERNEFSPHDLSTKIQLDRTFELVTSLEVAEHIVESSADTFIDNLVDLGDVILFSAADVGQGGEFHVNEKPSLYWKNKFETRGYVCYDFLRRKIRGNNKVMPWYRYNTFIYANKDGANRLSRSVLDTAIPVGESAVELYSIMWRIRLLIIRNLPAWLSTLLAELNSKFKIFGQP